MSPAGWQLVSEGSRGRLAPNAPCEPGYLICEQVPGLPRAGRAPGSLCWAFAGRQWPTRQGDRADGRACFSSLQAAGTSTAAPAPAKASRPPQLRPKSPQVVPMEEFQGKGRPRLGQSSSHLTPPPPWQTTVQAGGPAPGSEPCPEQLGQGDRALFPSALPQGSRSSMSQRLSGQHGRQSGRQK